MDLPINVLPVYLVPEVLEKTDPTSAVLFGRLLNFGALPGKDVYYSIRNAAKELHVSVNTVQRAFKALAEKGFLKIKKIKTVKSSGNPTYENHYLVNFSAISHVSDSEISGSDTPMYQFLRSQKVIRKEERSSKKGEKRRASRPQNSRSMTSAEIDDRSQTLAEQMRALRNAEAASNAVNTDFEEVSDDDGDKPADALPLASGDKK